MVMSIDYTGVVTAVMGVLDKRFNLNFEEDIMNNLRVSLYVAINKATEPLLTALVNDVRANVSGSTGEGKRKRAPTAYNLFTQDYQLNHPGESNLFVQSGAAWKKTTPTERAPFERRAQELADQHRQEQSGGKMGKRPPNCYNLFMRQYKKDHPDVPNLFQAAATAWRNITAEEKQVWIKRAEALRPKKNTRKGFLTGYNLFVAAHMSSIAAKHASWSNKDCMRQCSTLWHECNKSEWNTRAIAINEQRAKSMEESEEVEHL